MHGPVTYTGPLTRLVISAALYLCRGNINYTACCDTTSTPVNTARKLLVDVYSAAQQLKFKNHLHAHDG